MAKKATEKNEATGNDGGKSLVRKITNKALFSSDGTKPSLGDKKSLELGTVMGIARSVKAGETDYGPWTKLLGSFEALTHDGRVLQSPQCILPEPMQGMIAESLADENTESIQFAVKVKMVKADTATGYEYQTETVVESDHADPLADLRSKALPNLS